jgi:hypothetical protein
MEGRILSAVDGKLSTYPGHVPLDLEARVFFPPETKILPMSGNKMSSQPWLMFEREHWNPSPINMKQEHIPLKKNVAFTSSNNRLTYISSKSVWWSCDRKIPSFTWNYVLYLK